VGASRTMVVSRSKWYAAGFLAFSALFFKEKISKKASSWEQHHGEKIVRRPIYLSRAHSDRVWNISRCLQS
jgi:hypothetical protein